MDLIIYLPLFKGKLGTGEALQEKRYYNIISNNLFVRKPT